MKYDVKHVGRIGCALALQVYFAKSVLQVSTRREDSKLFLIGFADSAILCSCRTCIFSFRKLLY